LREFLLKTDVRSFFTTTFLKFFFPFKNWRQFQLIVRLQHHIGIIKQHTPQKQVKHTWDKTGVSCLPRSTCSGFLFPSSMLRKNVHTQRRTRARTHAHARTYTHAHTHARMHTCTHACTHARTCTHTRTRAHAHTLTHPHTDGGIRRSVV